MQRVYDITVTELGRTDPNNTDYTYDGKPPCSACMRCATKF